MPFSELEKGAPSGQTRAQHWVAIGEWLGRDLMCTHSSGLSVTAEGGQPEQVDQHRSHGASLKGGLGQWLGKGVCVGSSGQGPGGRGIHTIVFHVLCLPCSSMSAIFNRCATRIFNTCDP